MKKLFDSSQRFLRLKTSSFSLFMYHRISVAYPLIRKILLLSALVLYSFLAYFGNRELFAEGHVSNLAAIRVTVTMVIITAMTLIADRWMRRYFGQNRWGKLLPRLLLLILVAAGLRVLGDAAMVAFLQPHEVVFFGGPVYFVTIFLTTFLVPIYLLPVHLADGWMRRNSLQSQLHQQELEMKTLKLEAELKFLRAQIHPHFLFNILNNIYSLIEIEPPQAQEVVLKLSAMMQYMLYDSQEEKVSLDKEIQYLHNFIELHQLKKDGEMNIVFETHGVEPGMKIPPLLLVPLFENVFKHGNLENLKQGWMKAVLTASPTGLEFLIQNSYTEAKPHDLPGGIGLENVKERLQWLYPDRHAFSIEKTADQFSINLRLEWNPQTFPTT